MASDREPAFNVARTLLQDHQTARRLVQELRILRSQNSCQFSADAENIAPGTVDDQSHSIAIVREPMEIGRTTC